MSDDAAGENSPKTSEVGESAPPGPVTAPYVGVRALNRNERELLVGRDTDIQFLGDKILTGSLTVFYGRSGLGKTSLLKAALIPELRDEGAIVAYVDSWAQSDPLAAVKRALVERARDARISNAGGGAPTLTELAQLVAAGTQQTVILILDQFEEFLFAHAGDLDPLRREIAALVRSTVDAHVVLSIREEFLAVLEPFREEILTLFSSTYRLEPLPQSELRKAITVPAEMFNVEYDAKLVDRLLADLHEEEAGRLSRRHGDGGTPVELPFLQLVCKRLWESRAPEQTRLDVATYEALGGVRTILSTYVQSVMPSTRAGRGAAAEVLKYVAPPTGLKVAYSLAHLTRLTGLSHDEIEALLAGWTRAFILRVRTEDGGARYELLHDALIAVLGPWRDAVLEDARVWRRWRLVVQAALIVSAVVLALLAASVVASRRAVEEQTNEPVAKNCRAGEINPSYSEAACVQAFDRATSYFLWSYEKGDRFSTLVEFLSHHAGELPSGYGMSHPDARLLRSPVESWPNTLEYSPQRHMDPVQFGWVWQDQAARIVDDLGIPVPLRLRLVAREGTSLDASHVRLTIPPADPIDFDVSLDVPTQAGAKGSLAPDACAYVFGASTTSFALLDNNDVRSHWGRLPAEKTGPDWWQVPRWSLPAWKVSGTTITDGSGMVAVSVAAQLRAQRRLLLFPAVLDDFLESVDPATRTEAHHARPATIRADIVAAVEAGASLVEMPALLELMTEHPSMKADELVRVLTHASPRPHAHLRRTPWSTESKKKGPPGTADATSADAVNRKELPGYDEAKERMRRPSAALRVDVSEEAASWLEEHRVEARKRVEEALDRFAKRYGVEPRDIEFHADATLHEDELRVGSPGDVGGATRATLHCHSADMLDALVAQLDDELEKRAGLWVDAPLVDRLLMTSPPHLNDWIRERYTTTDLKLVLRAVVEPDRGREGPRSLRHASWLLASLAFWSVVERGDAPEDIATRLRETQAARADVAAIAVGDDVRQGIIALERDDPKRATTSFEKALKADPVAAIGRFLSAYGSVARTFTARQLLTRDEPEGARGPRALRRVERAELEEMDRFPTESLGPGGLAARDRSVSPVEFAARALRRYDPTRPGTQILDVVRSGLASLMVRASDERADEVYRAVLDVCHEKGPKNWCWQLLDDLCMQRKDPRLRLDLAFQLDGLDGGPFVARAEQLAHELTTTYAAFPLTLAWARFLEAQSIIKLDSDDPARPALARELLTKVSAVRDPDVGAEATEWLAYLALSEGQEGVAKSLLADWQQRLPSSLDDGSFHGAQASLEASLGDMDGAEAEARIAVEQAQLHHRDALGAVSLGVLFGRDWRWWEQAARSYLDTGSAHADYLRLIVFARLARAEPLKADRLVAGREVDPGWGERARGGDAAVWREMLVAYYAGKLPRAHLFAPLETEEAFRKQWGGTIAQERGGMSCEAWFYDALLEGARGNESAMRSGMATVVDRCSHRTFTEYEMARHFLAGRAWPRP